MARGGARDIDTLTANDENEMRGFLIVRRTIPGPLPDLIAPCFEFEPPSFGLGLFVLFDDGEAGGRAVEDGG